MLVKVTSFEVCESEHYVGCQIYKMCTCDFNCEYLHSCANQYIEKMPKFVTTSFMDDEGIKNMTDVLMKYCLSPETSKICAKYQLYSKGETPTINLMPDGRKLSPFDFLFKRKNIVHLPE
jgi:hypothetical protein